jgi:hypothetical protein
MFLVWSAGYVALAGENSEEMESSVPHKTYRNLESMHPAAPGAEDTKSPNAAKLKKRRTVHGPCTPEVMCHRLMIGD